MTPMARTQVETMSTTASPTFADFYAAAREVPIYVILGVQGSGTNLLRKFLVTAFNFSVLQDHALIFNAAAQLGRSPDRAAVERQFAAVHEAIFPSGVKRLQRQLIKGAAVEPFRGVAEHFDPSLIRSGADFARFFYAYRAYSLGTTRMAIKSDDLWEHIHAIDDVLPNRQVILITRDFRDNLLSVADKDFGPIEPLCAAEYVKHHFSYYDAEYRRAGDRGYHVRYETMLRHPKQFVLDFAARFQLSPIKNVDDVVAEIALKPDRVEKWRKLNPRDLERCEATLRTELVGYGYSPATPAVPPPGALTRMAATLRDVCKRVPQKLRSLRQRLIADWRKRS
jgi:hypothetical protein